MEIARLRHEAIHDMYRTQRERREAIRDSVATPVAALAFSVFNLGTLAVHYDTASWATPVGLVIAVLGAVATLCLVGAAALVIRMEYGFVYYDPPDLEEMVRAENALREEHADERDTLRSMYDFLAASYDIIYRQYFTENEQAARDRTRALRLILVALCLFAVSLALLPWQVAG